MVPLKIELEIGRVDFLLVERVVLMKKTTNLWDGILLAPLGLAGFPIVGWLAGCN